MGLILKKGTAKADRAYGKSIASYGKKDADGKVIKSIKYPVEWFEYADSASMQEAHDELTLDEQLKVRNVEKKTTARQAANTAALDAIGIKKETEETSSQLRLKTVFKGMYAKNLSKGMEPEAARLAARAKAAEMLEEEWEDGEGDEEDVTEITVN